MARVTTDSLPSTPSSSSFTGLWSSIGDIGRDRSSGGYRRFAWTEVDLRLREWFAGEAGARGFDLVEDRMGNQWAWWGDPDVSSGIVTGSHLDSVPDGGAYDGPLGVVSAFAAVDALRASGFEPARPIGVVNFVDEEGARFGVACAGSRVITGALSGDRARALTDADGVTMAQAWRSLGRVPADLGPDPETLKRVGHFIELHVEQGRGLIDLGRPVAVGRDIWPHGRWRIDIPGEANHAGTTRLADRQDAMLRCAALVVSARSAAERRNCLTTVGKLLVEPGGVNAIPAHVTAWLDARGPDEDGVRAATLMIKAEAEELTATMTEESWTPATPFDPTLADRLASLLDQAPVIGTGAGHDAGILANAGVSTGMIFVRNPTGISHSPAEFAEADDCLAGVDALTTVLAELAGPVTPAESGAVS